MTTSSDPSESWELQADSALHIRLEFTGQKPYMAICEG